MKACVIASVLTVALLMQQRTPAEIAADLERIAAEVRALVKVPAPEIIVVRAGDNLQQALDRASAGATIELAPGATFTCNCVVKNSVNITTLEASLSGRAKPEDASALATITSGNGGTTLDITASNVKISLVHIYGGIANETVLIGHNDATQTQRTQQPKDVTLDQVLIDGAAAGGAKRGVSAHGINITIRRSSIWNFKRVGQDTQAIWINNGEGPYLIEDNYLEAAGENLMSGGDTPRITGMIPSGITVTNNSIAKPLTWRTETWTIKNLLELKAGRDVTVRGNMLSGSWVGGQGGFAFMLTPQGEPTVQVANVTIANNIITNVGGGVSILGVAQIGTSLQTCGVHVDNNWFTIDGTTFGGHGNFMQIGRGPCDIQVTRTTVQQTGNQIVLQSDAPVPGFVFTRNLIPKSGAYGFTGRAADGSNQHRAAHILEYFPGAVITDNAFGSFPAPANLPGNLFLASSSIAVIGGVGQGSVQGYGWTIPVK